VVGLRDLAFGYRIQRTEADRFKVAATQLLKLSTQKPPRRTVHSFATFSVFRSVDAGRGLLIFALPPGEAAFHPSDENGGHELYFICDDLKAEMASLAKKDVKCTEVQEARWGSITKMPLPGGGLVGLYQPKHPLATDLK
jgi:hypothetical protein